MQSSFDFLICEYCQEVLDSPIILPCGDRICQKHLSGQESIKCFICSMVHQVDEASFPVDKILQKLIVLNIKCGQSHVKAKSAFERHQVLLFELENLIKDPFNYLYEYITSIRNTVCIEKELNRLNDLQFEKLLDILDSFENNQKTNFYCDHFFLNKLEQSRSLSKKIEPHLHEFNEDEKYWRQFNSELSNESLKLDYYIMEFKAAVLDNKQLTFIKPISSEAYIEIKRNQVKLKIYLLII